MMCALVNAVGGNVPGWPVLGGDNIQNMQLGERTTPLFYLLSHIWFRHDGILEDISGCYSLHFQQVYQ